MFVIPWFSTNYTLSWRRRYLFCMGGLSPPRNKYYFHKIQNNTMHATYMSNIIAILNKMCIWRTLHHHYFVTLLKSKATCLMLIQIPSENIMGFIYCKTFVLGICNCAALMFNTTNEIFCGFMMCIPCR